MGLMNDSSEQAAADANGGASRGRELLDISDRNPNVAD